MKFTNNETKNLRHQDILMGEKEKVFRSSTKKEKYKIQFQNFSPEDLYDLELQANDDTYYLH